MIEASNVGEASPQKVADLLVEELPAPPDGADELAHWKDQANRWHRISVGQHLAINEARRLALSMGQMSRLGVKLSTSRWMRLINLLHL